MTDAIPVVFLDDRLCRGACAGLPSCRDLVETLRLGTGRYRRLRRVFIATTPSELRDLPQEIIAERGLSLAVLDLDLYPDIAAVMEAARTRTEKRGRVTRDVSRARRLGYYAKPFVFEQHIPDIVEIHQSKEVRQGEPLSAYYHKTVEAFGGAATQPLAVEPPSCPEHNWPCWGVFLAREGHMQGAVRTDEQLVGYIKMRRQGDSASYTAIMGHGGHLINGIMYLLHFEIVAAMLRTERAQRPRYLVYLNYHPRSTLGEWKRRALFEPRYLHYVDERIIGIPDSGAPAPEQGRRALDASLQAAWSNATVVAKKFEMSVGWLALLQRAWMIEQTRGAGAVSALLDQGAEAIEALQWFRSNLLPLHEVDRQGAVAVALSGNNRGVDTLLELHDAGFEDVEVYHARPEALELLQRCYGTRWTYRPWSDRTVIPEASKSAIIECARDLEFSEVARMLASFTGTVLLSVQDFTLESFFGFTTEKITAIYEKDSAATREMQRALCLALGRMVRYRAMHYRCTAAGGDVFWLCFNLE